MSLLQIGILMYAIVYLCLQITSTRDYYKDKKFAPKESDTAFSRENYMKKLNNKWHRQFVITIFWLPVLVYRIVDSIYLYIMDKS